MVIKDKQSLFLNSLIIQHNTKMIGSTANKFLLDKQVKLSSSRNIEQTCSKLIPLSSCSRSSFVIADSGGP